MPKDASGQALSFLSTCKISGWMPTGWQVSS